MCVHVLAQSHCQLPRRSCPVRTMRPLSEPQECRCLRTHIIWSSTVTHIFYSVFIAYTSDCIAVSSMYSLHYVTYIFSLENELYPINSCIRLITFLSFKKSIRRYLFEVFNCRYFIKPTVYSILDGLRITRQLKILQDTSRLSCLLQDEWYGLLFEPTTEHRGYTAQVHTPHHKIIF